MGNEVYANGREVSCKAANGKSICAFPDVCMTPPQTPATPPGVPIPYPNTGLASDTTDGSKNVKISGKEVMLKDKSYFKKSTGDEAGSAPMKNVITHKIQGKVYFNTWSMDIKFEGENVVRHLDLATHNHASPPAGTPPWVYGDSQAPNINACKTDRDRAETACKDYTTKNCSDECKNAQRCLLYPKKKDKEICCETDTTGHHLVEAHCFMVTGERKTGTTLEGFGKYKDRDAPCVCGSSSRADGTHGTFHAVQGQLESAYLANAKQLGTKPLKSWPGAGAYTDVANFIINIYKDSAKGIDKKDTERKKKLKAIEEDKKKALGKLDAVDRREEAHSHWNYGQARDAGVLAHQIAFGHCKPECITQQLDAYHKTTLKLTEDSPLRTDPSAEHRSSPELDQAQKEALEVALDKLTPMPTGM